LPEKIIAHKHTDIKKKKKEKTTIFYKDKNANDRQTSTDTEDQPK